MSKKHKGASECEGKESLCENLRETGVGVGVRVKVVGGGYFFIFLQCLMR